MAMGNLPVPRRPAVWMIVGQGPTALPVLCKILFAFSGEVAKMRLLLNMYKKRIRSKRNILCFPFKVGPYWNRRQT